MNEEQHQMIVKQQKTLSESLRDDKEFWRDIYSFFEVYTKEFVGLFNVVNVKSI
jgi:hypothetical protein